MKNTNITKAQAITIIGNILREGCTIPMASIGDGGAGLSYVSPPPSNDDSLEFLSALKDFTFRIVPPSEISEEFSDIDLNEYDVCVEFSTRDNSYSEQYLLWNLDYYKD